MPRPRFTPQGSSGSRKNGTSGPFGTLHSMQIPNTAFHTDDAWVDRYAPQTSALIAMNPSKLGDIRTRLVSSDRLIVITGPAGSGKSTAVRVLAHELQQELIEWHAPETVVGETQIVEALDDFLQGAALGPHNSLILVDDLPNLFHADTRDAFEGALLRWLDHRTSGPKLVVVFTEIVKAAPYHEAAVAERVFGSVLEGVPRNRSFWIETNPVAARYLRDAVLRVANMELNATATKLVPTDRLIGGGDVRSALNTLEFWARAPSAGTTMISDRGAEVRFFHAIGKIVHGTDRGDLEEVIESFADSRENFYLTLLENYTKAKKGALPIEAAAEASQWLSDGALGLPGAALAVALIIKGSKTVNGIQRFQQLEGSKQSKSHHQHISHRIELNQLQQRYGARPQEVLDLRDFPLALNHAYADQETLELDPWLDSESQLEDEAMEDIIEEEVIDSDSSDGVMNTCSGQTLNAMNDQAIDESDSDGFSHLAPDPALSTTIDSDDSDGFSCLRPDPALVRI